MRVPVVRVYGPLETGEQAVVHVHGAFPFLYVPVPPGPTDPAQFAARLHSDLESVLSETFHRSTRTQGFVHAVTPCRGRDFYGYSPLWTAFAKVELLNPVHIYKCADLLRNGAIGTQLQPYESHIPFLLAFLADYDLYGCDWLVFAAGKDRATPTAFQGRELDIEVGDILPSRESRLRDSPVSITSLAEARSADAAWRSAHGVAPWGGTKLQPQFQTLARDWPWERAAENRERLGERLRQKPPKDEGSMNIESLPTVTNLRRAPSTAAMRAGSSISIGSSTGISSSTGIGSYTSIGSSTVASNSAGSQAGSATSAESHIDSSQEIWSDEDLPSFSEKPHLGAAFCSGEFLQYALVSPSTGDVKRTHGIDHAVPEPFFSDPSDVPTLPFTYGQRTFALKSHEAADLEPLAMTPAYPRLLDPTERLLSFQKRSRKKPQYDADWQPARLEYAVTSPTSSEVARWLESPASQVTSAPTSYQFASLGTRESEEDEMSVCVAEVHVNTRFGKAPKPTEDAVGAVFWRTGAASGVITTNPLVTDPAQSVLVVESEQAIFDELIAMVRFFNPDILTGYEILTGSWGYLQARHSIISGGPLSLYELIGRVAVTPAPWKVEDAPSVLGRHVLNLWNVLRHEVTLNKYTLEYVVYHCLHERTPHFGTDELHRWWQSGERTALTAAVVYFTRRTELVLRLLAHFEVVNRTCEKSRIIGIDFYSSLTRGSQFQVEAVLCRLARKQDFVLVSPSKHQVAQQNALEYIPLVMEPRSQYYTDPVCVLDFRSLYPSIVIAYNLCYSTCLGNVQLWRDRNKVGVKQDFVGPAWGDIGEENIYVAPNGMAYVAPQVRPSLLARMLGEILDTRFMTNATRKAARAGPTASARLDRNLNNRQLALKFIANVTYGYTSASFSGRMPLAELADSIVATGRELLEHSIRLLEAQTQWGVRPQVVYGDTDSLFVRLPGVARDAAFRIGEEMAALVTSSTPEPVLLKLEKVYHPCILLTKKRYVGNSYDAPGSGPLFDAKGVETVRRDGTPIVQQVEKRALQTLFASSDLTKVKRYLQGAWRRMWQGECRPQDFCFSQEVKLGHYRGEASLPGGAVVSLRRMQTEGFEPQYRERVPFLVTAGAPGSRINDRVVSPEEFIGSSLVLDYEYYIQRVIIPPLERLFNLLGANVREWYTHMPRTVRVSPTASARGTLLGFLESDTCQCCLERRRNPPSILCKVCQGNQPRSRYVLLSRHRHHEQVLAAAQTTCNLCSPAPQAPAILGGELEHPCRSIDCAIYFERAGARTAARESAKTIDW